MVFGRGSVIDKPTSPKTKLPQLKLAYPQLSQVCAFEYPMEANLLAINKLQCFGTEVNEVRENVHTFHTPYLVLDSAHM